MGRHFYVLVRSFECSCMSLYFKEHLGVCVFLFVSVCDITVCEAARFSFFLCVYPRVCVVVYLCECACMYVGVWAYLYMNLHMISPVCLYVAMYVFPGFMCMRMCVCA